MKKFLLACLILISSVYVYSTSTFKSPPRRSVLSDLASGMSPGSWAELTGSNISDPGLLIDISGSGALTPYAYSGVWDSSHEKLHFIGSDHGDWQCIHSVYDAITNTWSRGPDTELTGPGTVNHQPNNNACLHGFDHQAIDKNTGDIYWTAGNGGEVWKLPYGGSTWAKIPDWNNSQGNATFNGTAFWTGSISGSSSGAWFLYNCMAYWDGTPPQDTPTQVGHGMDGQVVIYSPGSNTWITNGNDLGRFGYYGGYTYQCFADYSEVNNIGIFGGGGVGHHIWRLNSDRTVTALADGPTTMGVEYGNLAEDPGSGKFVMVESGNMYEFNPLGSGSWTSIGTVPSPASSWVGYPNVPTNQRMFSTSITNHGVIMYIGCGTQTCKAYLYKHSESTTDTSHAGRVRLRPENN